MKLTLFFSMVLVGALFSCNADQKRKEAEEAAKQEARLKLQNRELDFSGGMPALVYKTKADYNRKVAVMLSEDNSFVQGYPQPKDLFASSLPTYPTELSGGYLLDHQGITPKVAFLQITYSEYSQLPEAPSQNELMAMIIDRDPLVEVYDCGNRFQFRDAKAELNALIENDLLSKCRKIK
ncbi:hypothetical protein BH24BAC1_BH24BAC1_33290 [soil metagenome]